jgi:hypothetical protein
MKLTATIENAAGEARLRVLAAGIASNTLFLL